MNRSTLLSIANSLLALALLGLITPVLVFEFAFEEGGEGATFLGRSSHGWLEIHEIFGFALLGLAVVHLALNWNWVVAKLKGLKSGS